jgi:hypothetical protein
MKDSALGSKRNTYWYVDDVSFIRYRGFDRLTESLISRVMKDVARLSR